MPERVRIKDIAKLANVSVGTVDRVLHGRNGVSESSKKKVEEILKQLNYQPNMYASALATNKKYRFACILPRHTKGEYWEAVEFGIKKAVSNFSDFHITLSIVYYDQYDFISFLSAGHEVLSMEPDGIVLSPTSAEITIGYVNEIKRHDIPYVFIDSTINGLQPLAFFGQNSDRSGYFAARIAMLLAERPSKIVIFRQITDGKLGSNQQENREKGFRRFMKENYPCCKIMELNLSAKDPNKDKPLMDDFFILNPDVECGITFNSKVYVIGEYLLSNKIRNFKLVGYDLLDRNIKCLREGSVNFLIAQQPITQGYKSVESLCNHLIFKKDVKRYNYMPITLLNMDNLDFYLDSDK